MDEITGRRLLTSLAIAIAAVMWATMWPTTVAVGCIGGILALHVFPVDANGPKWGPFEETALHGMFVALVALIALSWM